MITCPHCTCNIHRLQQNVAPRGKPQKLATVMRWSGIVKAYVPGADPATKVKESPINRRRPFYCAECEAFFRPAERWEVKEVTILVYDRTDAHKMEELL